LAQEAAPKIAEKEIVFVFLPSTFKVIKTQQNGALIVSWLK
jgi:hypothetical protein